MSAACEAGPVEGTGAVAVREAATAVKKSFADALSEEKGKVNCTQVVHILQGVHILHQDMMRYPKTETRMIGTRTRRGVVILLYVG